MGLKDTATRTAVLSVLADVINAELKASKAELQQGLKAAKAETGTQQVGMELPDGQDIGKATLVQPKATAVVTGPDLLIEWVRENAPAGSITSRVVTEIRPSYLKVLLAEITAAGVAQWCDKETGEVHDVPGVQIQGRAAYTRTTIPDTGKQAIAQAWREGALTNMVLPELTAGGES